jgi:predicted GNAT family N-acyltransferase
MTAAVDYEVRRYRGEREMTELLALRHEVFCVEQGVSVREEHDGRDGEGVHLVAVSDGSVLATCRLLFDTRRRGIASRLLELADQETRAGGARRIVLHAQTYARSLYEGAGYQPRGRVFMESGIEHIAMEKRL